MYLFIYLYIYLFICNIICLYYYIFIFINGLRRLEGDRRQMWEEPEKDKGRDKAGQEGGGEVDQGMSEGTKGKPRATDWEDSGRGTAAERIIGQRTIETAGCDGCGKFMGRMGEGIGKNGRKCCDILGGLLGRMRKDIGRNGRKCATYWEGYFDSSGKLLRQIGRILGNIGNVFIIIIGELVAAKRRDAATYREVCGDKWGESLGTMGIYTTE